MATPEDVSVTSEVSVDTQTRGAECWPVSLAAAIKRAALFPEFDLPDLPPAHPNRRVSVGGAFVRLPVGLPIALVSLERVEESCVERLVDDVRQVLRAEGRDKGLWFVPETASPSDLAERLRGLGMRPNDFAGAEAREAAMVAVEAPPPGPPGVVARRPANFEEFLAGVLITPAAFALDDSLRRAFEERAERLWPVVSADGVDAVFVAVIDGEVVSFAVAQFGRTAVYLGGGATRPDRRGRGAYRALVRARWDAAVEQGIPALTVGAGAMSRPILERLGFSIVGWTDRLVDEVSA
jgi:GNAT superfamily N-acetyltransferase